MIYHLKDVEDGFEVEADVVVVGSGAGGSVAARNLAAAGMRTVVIEAGPQIAPEEMTRDAPRFLARYFWEGGLRLLGGPTPIPTMQGRCLGGSTVVNSAIMLKLPEWVRHEWIREEGLSGLEGPALDAAFERVFEATSTAPTPMEVMGRRNLIARDAMAAMGLKGYALPRAVKDCKGCGDCLVGCAGGHKQSTDRSYIPHAVADGASVYTCSQVERVWLEGSRAVGVRGWVVDPRGRRRLSRFSVRAPRIVLAAGTLATPVILQRSRINPRRLVGRTLHAHLSGGVVGVMDERVEPWVGATQGWGAISEAIPGMKYESLWAPPSVLTVRWGGVGASFLKMLPEIAHFAVLCVVYRGRCSGRVRARRDGLPAARLSIPDEEARVVYRGCQQLAEGLLRIGARRVHGSGGMPGVPEPMRTIADTHGLLSPRLGAKHLSATANHIFGSCRMSADPRRGPVDPDGRLRGVEGVYVCDASLFPSPSAVNPQATIMALADVITRRLGEQALT